MSAPQGKALEVTVVKCNNLKVDDRSGKQDPYVCVEYAEDRYHTRTCADGGENPVFQDKFSFILDEEMSQMVVSVYNSTTLRPHDFKGKGRVSLQTVKSKGRDESAWPIKTKEGKSAGEVCLVLHCPAVAGPTATTNKTQVSTKPKVKPCSSLCSFWCPTGGIRSDLTVPPSAPCSKSLLW